MPMLTWDTDKEHRFELGISKGVLFVKSDILSDEYETDYDRGVAWTGLTSVEINSEGFESKEIEMDDFLTNRLYTPEIAAGTIEAYAYPKEFNKCQGVLNPSKGVYVKQQQHQSFALVYRTEIFNEYSVNESAGYIIHILYNCVAKPPEIDRETYSDSPEPVLYSWEFDAVPVELDGYMPFTEMTIDSTKLASNKLKALEALLYGSDETAPMLLRPDALFEQIFDNADYSIYPYIPPLEDLTEDNIATMQETRYYLNIYE